MTGVKQVLREVGAVVGSINLIEHSSYPGNDCTCYPSDRVDGSAMVAPSAITELAESHGIAAWTGFGALYGNAGIVKAAGKTTVRILKPASTQLRFITPTTIATVRPVAQIGYPGWRGSVWSRRAQTLAGAMQMIAGKPSRREHCLSPIGEQSGLPPGDGELNPARGAARTLSGIPAGSLMAPASVRRCVAMVHEVCSRHGIEPLITLTSLSDRCFRQSLCRCCSTAVTLTPPGARTPATLACLRRGKEAGLLSLTGLGIPSDGLAGFDPASPAGIWSRQIRSRH